MTAGPFTLKEVLLEEFSRLRPALRETLGAGAVDLRTLYATIARLGMPPSKGGASPQSPPLSALCLSGGGIRSATFNLGVIQGLARTGLLGAFDYLSSVSGGGYIASWLRTWMYREGAQKVISELARADPPRDPLAPEPEPVDNLREFSNYLTPKLGLFSADTWTAVAIVLRNLILNWLVMVPLLGAVIAVPQALFLAVKSRGFPLSWGCYLLGLALLIELVASILLYWLRRFVKKPQTHQGVFVAGGVLPICLAAAALTTAVLGLDLPWAQQDPSPSTQEGARLWGFALLWCIVIPIIGWGVSEIGAAILHKRKGVQVARDYVEVEGRGRLRYVARGYELAGLVVSGAVAAAILVGMVSFWMPYLLNRPALYVVLGLPLLLGLYLLARVLFVAIASRAETPESRKATTDFGPSNDADREWWARLSAWVLIVIVAWTALTAVCLLGGYLLEVRASLLSALLQVVVPALGGVSGIVAALSGSRGDRAATTPGGDAPSGAKKWLFAAAAPVFVVCVIILIGWGTIYLGEKATGIEGLSTQAFKPIPAPERLGLSDYVPFLWVPLGLLAIFWVAGLFVNVNRFSLHGMYRNRLVRAYLGASNLNRQPDPFTGFALSDNPRLHELWREAEGGATRPLPIINTTLNLVSGGEKLAWQQRKAESFSMTPFYCGNWHEGYRRAQEYGGPQGISVGTAVTISGAAVNPNMGSSSSPAIGFLLALFNVRLGAWLGNTNRHGQQTYTQSGPRHSASVLLAELFGLTNARRRFVNLSDGGHFDNLGLYEVVLRRCRHILVCDAGQDRKFAFEDLGNAIRKVRIDFGISIQYRNLIRILPGRGANTGAYCAVAQIPYSEIDGTDKANDGWLVYLKPTLCGTGDPVPYDVYSYGALQPDFPHETTLDQWFSESQFESYRMLGLHTVVQIILGDKKEPERDAKKLQQFSTVGEFVTRVVNYLDAWKAPAAGPPSA